MLNIKEKQLLTVLMNSQNLEIHQKLQSDYMALDIFNLIGAIFNEKNRCWTTKLRLCKK